MKCGRMVGCTSFSGNKVFIVQKKKLELWLVQNLVDHAEACLRDQKFYPCHVKKLCHQ
jgi:hypothetical protein